MAITNYYSINGELIGEKVGTSARTDYLTDALGNVTATLNQSGQIVNTYRYKPYGAQLGKRGVGAAPAFGWVGNRVYRQTGKKSSDVYVRTRHYDQADGRWTSKDRITLYVVNLHQYSYASPLSFVDPYGMLPQQAPPEKHYDQPCCSDDNQNWYFNKFMGSHCKG